MKNPNLEVQTVDNMHDNNIAMQSNHYVINKYKLKEKDITAINKVQEKHGLSFAEAAVKLKLISLSDLRDVVTEQYNFPYLLNNETKFSRELVTAFKPFSSGAEEFRNIRFSLLKLWFNNNKHKGLAVISPQTKEGKSYFCANMAVCFSQYGFKTLLIDANLRSPRQHKIFDLPNEVGLSTFLTNMTNGRLRILTIPFFPYLHVVPSGPKPPNPLELLSKKGFADKISALYAHYDVVIFDTPPAIKYADAEIISEYAGGAVLVVRKHMTKVMTQKKLLSRYKEHGILVIGSLYNSLAGPK